MAHSAAARKAPHAVKRARLSRLGVRPVAGAPMRGLVEKNVLDIMEAMYGPEGQSHEQESKDGKNAIPVPVMACMRFRARLARMPNILVLATTRLPSR